MSAAAGYAGTRHARNDWPVAPEMNMRRTRQLNARNRIDLQDADQIRSLKRRLGISNDDLHRLVAKVGNSISAVTKEVEFAKAPSVKPAAVTIEAGQTAALTAPV